MVTNVKPNELNYDHYATAVYDEDIVRSIPGHRELHQNIDRVLSGISSCDKVTELGVGTGITAQLILQRFPGVHYTAIDFSETMLTGARKNLARYNIDYVLGDYAQLELPSKNDCVVSVIGIHHQETDADKKLLFQRIYDSLAPEGVFIFGDLMTYRDPVIAARNDALHFHYLVEHARDEKSLGEWAYHHKFLNKLAPLESQIEWLKEVGFREVTVEYQKFNTALIYARK